MRTIALQLHTIRHALALSPEAALLRVREAGFRAVETAPMPPGLTPRQLGGLLRGLGLAVTAAHTELPLGDQQAAVLDEAHELGAKRIVWSGWPRDPECDSLDGYRRLADRYAEAAEVARRHGLGFGIHNHWWECESLDGTYPYQWLHQLLPPGIFLELDVYWARVALLDPLKLMKEMESRISMLHLKDGPAVHGQPMTALGAGAVDIAGVVRAAGAASDFVVELDECATDPMDAARASLVYLEELLRNSD